MLVNVCPDNISSEPQNTLSPNMVCLYSIISQSVMQKNWSTVQCQGHSEGLYNQNMTISVVSSKQLVGLQPNLV